MPTNATHIAYFVSPHGYGHAARAAAVMAALSRRNPSLHFEIFTKVPQWFFQDSLAGSGAASFDYHEFLTDVGLLQKTSLEEDIPATIARLDSFLSFVKSIDFLDILAIRLQQLACRLVICDIAPLGIAVARRAGIPSVLVENFTWDWIYAGYLDDVQNESQRQRLLKHIDRFAELFAGADHHIQTEPICLPQPTFHTAPVSRNPRTPAAIIRRQLEIPAEAKLVLLTMGGVTWDYTFLDRLRAYDSIYFLIPGGSDSEQRQDNVILLPNHSAWYHPDLIAASDAVIGKLGYSTLAEVYHAGIPYGYIPRRRFRESPPLAAFVQSHMQGIAIPDESFGDGSWLSLLPRLLQLSRAPRPRPNGADQVAGYILNLLE